MDKNKWMKVDKNQVNLHELKRPSLTYWSDAFRRLKQNKLSMISLVFLMILIIAVIFVPIYMSKFHDKTFEEQKLAFTNTPPILKIYDIGDDDYIYVNNDYKAILVTKDGELLKAPDLINDDVVNRKKEYIIGEKEVIVDYGVYLKALAEYKRLEEALQDDPTIDLAAAKKKLNETNIFSLSVDGEEITQFEKVKNKSYLLGTDAMGRDFFIRVLYGGRISLTIAFVAALVNFIIGVIYGGISGYFGGIVDNIMMRIVDIISTIPLILYVIVLMVVLEPSLGTIILALSSTYWVVMARIVRAQVLSLKEQEFVLAAKTIGANIPRILFRHIIPNTMGPIMVALTMQIPTAIFTEAFLSFIGLGVSEPIPSWGALANDALKGFTTYPYLLLYPSLIMSFTLLAFNLLGDGLRDALDPRLRK